MNNLGSQHYIKYTKFIGIVFVLILLATMTRLVALDADPPTWYIPSDVGYHVDEGYKTFSAKNLFLFGAPHWNQHDVYSGWINLSPATQWPYYLAFKSGGLNLLNARIVTVIYFSLFLLVTALFLFRRIGPVPALLAIFVLGLDPGLFNFSRVALFEIPLIFMIYSGLYLACQINNKRRYLLILVVMLAGLIAAFTIKKSAILYIFPPLLALSGQQFFQQVSNRVLQTTIVLLGFVLFIVALYITRNTWMPRIDLLGTLMPPHNVFLNPIHWLSPFILFVAFIVLIDLMLRRPDSLFQDPFRLSLTAIVVMVPIMLAFFSYHPPRYYLPVIPAAVLLCVEWLVLNRSLPPPKLQGISPLSIIFLTVIFLGFAMTLQGIIGYYILPYVPVLQGEEAGISRVTMLRLFPITVILLAIFTYVVVRPRLGIFLKWTVIGGIMLQIGASVMIQGIVLTQPSYASQSIRNQLEKQVDEDESVAGGWAPFFAAESRIASLYMNINVNHPKDVHITRPDFFIFSNIPNDIKSLAILRDHPKVKLGEPIVLGKYYYRTILLYPLFYQSNSNNYHLSHPILVADVNH